jgi:hypothetical protein
VSVPNLIGELGVALHAAGAVLHGPRGISVEVELEATCTALREWIRYDGPGNYRPLSGARTLRRGWRLECETGRGPTIEEAIDAVYPLALEHMAAYAGGTLRIVSLNGTLARQTGRYAVARELSRQGRVAARDVLCSRCVREPVWAEAGGLILPGAIPCPEPCSVMVSLCREAALWESEPPPESAIDETVGWAAFETPGNEVREAYLRHR